MYFAEYFYQSPTQINVGSSQKNNKTVIAIIIRLLFIYEPYSCFCLNPWLLVHKITLNYFDCYITIYIFISVSISNVYMQLKTIFSLFMAFSISIFHVLCGLHFCVSVDRSPLEYSFWLYLLVILCVCPYCFSPLIYCLDYVDINSYFCLSSSV